MAGQINIGDTWKNVANIKINIGDTWKNVASAYININDTWKQWWPTTTIDGKYIYMYCSDGTTWKSDNSGTTWYVKYNVTAYYSDIACNSTGQYVLCDQGNPVKISSNYGFSYSNVSVTGGYAQFSLNASGSVMICGGGDGKIRHSETTGTTWSVLDLPGTAAYYGVCCNFKGDIQYYSGTGIYKSTDYGATYTTLISTGSHRLCACSANGGFLTVATMNGYLKVSNDSGATFQNKGVSASWYSVAMSLSGQYQIAGSENNLLYVSSDYGQTWTNKTVGAYSYYGVDCSGSGQIMVFGGWGGQSSYISRDYGQTWSTLNTTGNFAGVAINKYQ